jgi:Uma2 family endonuclease
MNTIDLDLTKRYTYSDYLTWLDDVRRELFDGFLKLMSPSPSLKHQEISGNLYRIISAHLYKKRCKVFYAPSDVRLPNKKDETSDKLIYTVVQPDIYIVCDPSKLDDKGCCGAPDFIIEIVSPKNAKRDVKDKYELYQKHGVIEYWIVYPYEHTVYVYVLNEIDVYNHVGVFTEEDKVKVNIFDDLFIDLGEVFE